MNPTTIGLDIAKNVFQAHGVNENGKVVVRKRLSRAKVLEFLANLPPCLIGMEACPGAHYWAREAMKLGHAVKLMAAQYVKAYVKGNKNDGNDAAAIPRGGQPPRDAFCGHQHRSPAGHTDVCTGSAAGSWRSARRSSIRCGGSWGNTASSSPKGQARCAGVWRRAARRGRPPALGDGPRAPRRSDGQSRALDERIANYDARVKAACATDERSAKLAELPGIGPLTAKARGECRGRGTGQQTRPDRLGGAGSRSDIPGGLGGAIRLTPTGKLLSRGIFDSKHTTDCEGEEPRDGKTG